MRSQREVFGGLGNQMFRDAYLWAQMRDGVISDIYVQSEKYFAKYREEIRTRYGSGIGFRPEVALHIRRGDYLKSTQFHTNLWDTDYYREAVKFFPDAKFLVFCKDTQNPAMDAADQEWCRENVPFLGIDFEMYEHDKETDDLNIMASCRGIIGANSSFSFWAAYLGNEDKKVVMPREERWFVDGVARTELPDTWNKI